ncbi:MAG: N-acetyltransferase [Phycisphaerae bacterium]|nr:MAG: N-acetyltransferase [Phycisphaerae bacterium]
MIIRLARESDAAACLQIYESIVRETAISFEEIAPTVDEMSERIRTTIKNHPWLVCCEPDAKPGRPVAGYAYAGAHRARAAYRWTVESAIYVDHGCRGRGAGRQLYTALFNILRLQGYRTVVAGATLPNDSSIAFHGQLGFETIGVFHNVGFKFGRWHNTQWFELDLKTNHAPSEPIPLSMLDENGEIARVIGDSLPPME